MPSSIYLETERTSRQRAYIVSLMRRQLAWLKPGGCGAGRSLRPCIVQHAGKESGDTPATIHPCHITMHVSKIANALWYAAAHAHLMTRHRWVSMMLSRVARMGCADRFLLFSSVLSEYNCTAAILSSPGMPERLRLKRLLHLVPALRLMWVRAKAVRGIMIMVGH
jgi:hypothetical protein